MELGTFKVFPNPYSEQTAVSFENGFEIGSALIVTDVLGRAVFRTEMRDYQTTIKSSQTGKGIFLLYQEESSGERTFLEKLIVE